MFKGGLWDRGLRSRVPFLETSSYMKASLIFTGAVRQLRLKGTL